jgi:hypothetical protein
MFQKLILISVVLATLVIPARAAREPNQKMALKKAVLQTLLFNLLYLFAVLVTMPRL